MDFMKKILISALCILALVSCAKKKEETVVVDDTVPTIDIINDELVFDDEYEYRYEDNVTVSFGESGGTVEFESEKNSDDETVSVIAKGNNGLNAYDHFRIKIEKTKDKKAIVFGDSIVYGILADRYSFANYLNDDYDFEKVVNAGYSDFRLSTYDDPNKWLIDAVKNHFDEDYDYVLLEGGVNDVLYLTPMGEIAADKNYESFDVNTFCGGMEAYLYTIVNRWPNAKIGYIITYYTKDYTERGLTWSYDDYKEYYDMQKKILDKWNIEYLDLFSDEFSELLEVDTYKYLPDKLHLNVEGHGLIAPYIYEWMKGLRKYS